MSLPQLNGTRYSLELLTENYLLQGVVEPVGVLMTYLDSPDRANILIKDVTMTGLDNDSTVNAIKIKELWIHREEIAVIHIDAAALEGSLQTLPAVETLRVFLPRFVIQATFHHGQDTRVGDMFEVMKGTWAAAYNARIYFLANMRTAVFREAPLLLINKHSINFYEPLNSQA